MTLLSAPIKIVPRITKKRKQKPLLHDGITDIIFIAVEMSDLKYG